MDRTGLDDLNKRIKKELNLMKAATSLWILFALPLAACGGGGDSRGAAETVSINPRDFYRATIVEPKVKTYAVSGTILGKPFMASGTWTNAAIATTRSGIPVYAQTISYKETSITFDGTPQTPGVDAATHYYGRDFRYIGSEVDGRLGDIEVTRQIELPIIANIGDSGIIFEYITYSDSSRKVKISTTTERWALIADAQSPVGAAFQIIRGTIFADPAMARDPLVYWDRYSIGSNGAVDFSARTVYLFSRAGETSLQYVFR
jgi:hypothetical protein